MENFEQILKRELGIFEKHFNNFKDEMKEEMSSFKTEMREEMSSFKTEIKDEMSSFKTEMKDEMSNFKTEIKDEIRERFFCFEQEYGRKIDGIYDVVVLNKQITDEKINDLDKRVKTNEMRIIKNSLEIDSLKSKKLNSKKLNLKN